MLIAAVKKITGFSDLECVFGFMAELARIARFDTEIFRASLGVLFLCFLF